MSHDPEPEPEESNRDTPVDPHSVIVDTVPPPNGFRDELTAASETRTIRLEGPPAWQVTPDPEPTRATRDPLFWPVVVFVAIIVAAIGIMLVSDPKAHPGAAHVSTFQ